MRSDRFLLLLALLALVGMVQPAPAQDAHATDKAALIKNAEAFLEAFHKGDAKALAAFWTNDGDYTEVTGRHLKGRTEIEKAFTGFFAENKGLKLRIDSESLRFVTPDVAIEEGMTAVIPPDGGPPSRARYNIVHVKKDGQWQLANVTDTRFTPPTQYKHLRELEWLIGEWAAANDKGPAPRVAYSWAKDQNFIHSSYAATFKSIAIGGGNQVIGYDPAAKQIRSWTFELNGGFGEGIWSRDGKKWTIKSTATTTDGAKLTLTQVFTHVDTDTFTWQMKDLTVGGKAHPDAPEVTMKRVK
jgi:uncharacterized protein (TIGR02246 family)